MLILSTSPGTDVGRQFAQSWRVGTFRAYHSGVEGKAFFHRHHAAIMLVSQPGNTLRSYLH